MLERLGVVVPGQVIKVENIAAVLVTTELPPSPTPAHASTSLSRRSGTHAASRVGRCWPPRCAAPTAGLCPGAGPLSIGGFRRRARGELGDGEPSDRRARAERCPDPGGQQVQLPAGGDLFLALQTPTSRRRGAWPTSSIASSAALRHGHSIRNGDGARAGRVRPGGSRPHGAARAAAARRRWPGTRGHQTSAPARSSWAPTLRIEAAAVAHGNLAVRISTRYEVSQPAPYSPRGETKVVPDQQLDVEEGDMKAVQLEEGATLDAIVRALNAPGRDAPGHHCDHAGPQDRPAPCVRSSSSSERANDHRTFARPRSSRPRPPRPRVLVPSVPTARGCGSSRRSSSHC